LTGAQKPGYGSSDFDRNFIKCIKTIIARLESPKNQRVAPGIKVAFGDKLMYGTTVVKEDEHGINAFAPAEKHSLAGRLNTIIDLYDANKNVKKRDFSLFTEFDQNVAYFECINGINVKQFENVVENKDVSAVLIGGYDSGNMPLQYKYYISTAVNSYNKPIAFLSHSDNGFAEIATTGRIGEFVKAGAIALGDMIKESAYQKMCFAMGLAKKKNLEGPEKISFVRKVMHTNFTGEIGDVFCEKGDVVYKELFPAKAFSVEDVENTLKECKEKNVSPVKSAVVLVDNKEIIKKKVV
jgi:L-asparaginase/Glu-tRNA(Gln) amidotransferase subunit D